MVESAQIKENDKQMTREQILNSVSLKKRFCKDYNLPITIYDNPYFYERLSAIDIMFDCIDKFDNFCRCLSNFESEQDYFEYYNEVKDKVIDYIKSNPAYECFNGDVFATKYNFPKNNLYVSQNDNCTFISIDMRKANFSALKHYDKAIFGGKETWEEFLGMFTDCSHILQSKYIRQVILGACNPKRQITYEHYLMGKLLTHIVENIPTINVYSLGEDEILIKVEKDCGYSKNQLQKVVSSCPKGIGNIVRIDIFDLHIIKKTSGWMKVMYDDESSIKFKCLEAETYHQIIKHYCGLPITENDLVFYHNGQLAKFLKEVDNPWQEE